MLISVRSADRSGGIQYGIFVVNKDYGTEQLR